MSWIHEVLADPSKLWIKSFMETWIEENVPELTRRARKSGSPDAYGFISEILVGPVSVAVLLDNPRPKLWVELGWCAMASDMRSMWKYHIGTKRMSQLFLVTSSYVRERIHHLRNMVLPAVQVLEGQGVPVTTLKLPRGWDTLVTVPWLEMKNAGTISKEAYDQHSSPKFLGMELKEGSPRVESAPHYGRYALLEGIK